MKYSFLLNALRLHEKNASLRKASSFPYGHISTKSLTILFCGARARIMTSNLPVNKAGCYT